MKYNASSLLSLYKTWFFPLSVALVMHLVVFRNSLRSIFGPERERERKQEEDRGNFIMKRLIRG